MNLNHLAMSKEVACRPVSPSYISFAKRAQFESNVILLALEEK